MIRNLLVAICILSSSLYAELVDLKQLDSTIRYDIRYASSRNRVGVPLYSKPVCYLHEKAAQALVKVQRDLRREGLCLKVFDAYRPLQIDEQLWSLINDEESKKSPEKEQGRHTRGTAVDLTLMRADGRTLAMHSEYNENQEEITQPRVLENRERLKQAMERHGFVQHEKEWWHFDFAGWEEYPMLSISFEELGSSFMKRFFSGGKGFIDKMATKPKELKKLGS